MGNSRNVSFKPNVDSILLVPKKLNKKDKALVAKPNKPMNLVNADVASGVMGLLLQLVVQG